MTRNTLCVRRARRMWCWPASSAPPRSCLHTRRRSSRWTTTWPLRHRVWRLMDASFAATCETSASTTGALSTTPLSDCCQTAVRLQYVVFHKMAASCGVFCGFCASTTGARWTLSVLVDLCVMLSPQAVNTQHSMQPVMHCQTTVGLLWL